MKSQQQSKIEEYIRRNHRRSKELYYPRLTLGVDYVICPHTNTRRQMIEKKYITRVLELTVAEYDALYPGIQKTCTAHKTNISVGVNQICPITGQTKHQNSADQRAITMSTVDPNTGMSGYKKSGQATRATHMANIDENGRTGYQQQAHARVTTVTENGLTVEQNAHIKANESRIKNGKASMNGASEISKKILAPIVQYLTDENIKFYFDKQEYAIMAKNGNYYLYDLTIPDFKFTIEYQSNAWHADIRMNDEQWAAWRTPRGIKYTADEVHEYDCTKARALYESRGYITHYVWENTQYSDVEELLCLIKTLNTKS
jgi:hypothetical protein